MKAKTIYGNADKILKRHCPNCGAIPTVEAENAAATDGACPFCPTGILQCSANPVDDGGPVTVDQARQIAREDASLIYSEVSE